MALTLYTYPGSSKSFKGLIAAEYSGVKINVPPFKMGEDNKSKEFLRKNPLGRVPTLETPDGCLFESNAIARHVARLGPDGGKALLGDTNLEQSQIDMWMTFANTELSLPVAAWIYPILGYIPFSKEGTAKAQEDVRRLLGMLDDHLKDKTYLVGTRVTLADITVACTLMDLYKHVLEPSFRKKFVNTNRWFGDVTSQQQFVAVSGPVELATKMAKMESNAAAAQQEVAGKKGAGKKGKGKNPLDELPQSSMSLAEFKKLYDSKDVRSAVIPEFWKSFDAEGFSLWRCKYKYGADVKMNFQATSIVNKFFEKCKGLEKYAFATMLIIGEDTDLEISGVWLFRGKEIPAEMQNCEDYEGYEWRKLNPNNKKDKVAVGDYFAWDGDTFKGKPVEGKKFM